MAGTDPFIEAEEKRPVSNAAAIRREYVLLRSLLIEPDEVFLVTVDGQRWLTDQYALINTTAMLLAAVPSEEDAPDGPYQLQAGKGFVPKDPGNHHLEPDVPGFIERMGKYEDQWERVHGTTVSIRKEERDLLVYTDRDGERSPFTIDARLWRGWHEAFNENPKEYRRAVFEKTSGKNQPFRILLDGLSPPLVVCYIQPVRIPEGGTTEKHDLREIAQYIVDHWQWRDE